MPLRSRQELSRVSFRHFYNAVDSSIGRWRAAFWIGAFSGQE
jgi:hypothetical protein